MASAWRLRLVPCGRHSGVNRKVLRWDNLKATRFECSPSSEGKTNSTKTDRVTPLHSGTPYVCSGRIIQPIVRSSPTRGVRPQP